MTTTTPTTTRTAAAVPSTARLSFGGIVRSELVKLTSLRSTRVAALALVLLVVAGMTLRAFAYAQVADPSAIGVGSEQAWRNVIDVGVRSGVLAAIVLAVLAVGSEYTDRTARTTFTAVPRRLEAFGAKALVAVLAVIALSAVGLLLGTAASVPLMSTATLTAPTPDTAGAALAGGLLLAVYAAVAVAVTVLVRSTAAGVTIVLVVLFVLPIAAALLGRVIGVDLGEALLSYAAPMATAAVHDPEAVSRIGWTVPVTIAWLVVPGAAAAAALQRRDV